MSVLCKDPKPLHVYLFIALSAVDVALTITALSFGVKELNLLFAAFQNPISMIAAKMILTGMVVLGLVIFHRVYFIFLLNAGMTLVVLWNIVAVLTWLHY